ncbi:hypothetical protein PR048_021854 [Dryococelus australis]|uniref:Uncharacterized protein n=1 Tax=Dryococelus australis TaxID=614101 RepID=A0ABQ9GZG5_9NEOP|nr:hypothetical protein PR048_021854 [Dryococelus australis]
MDCRPRVLGKKYSYTTCPETHQFPCQRISDSEPEERGGSVTLGQIGERRISDPGDLVSGQVDRPGPLTFDLDLKPQKFQKKKKNQKSVSPVTDTLKNSYPRALREILDVATIMFAAHILSARCVPKHTLNNTWHLLNLSHRGRTSCKQISLGCHRSLVNMTLHVSPQEKVERSNIRNVKYVVPVWWYEGKYIRLNHTTIDHKRPYIETKPLLISVGMCGTKVFFIQNVAVLTAENSFPEEIRFIDENNVPWKLNLLTSHQGEPGSIPDRVTPGFSHVGIVPDDVAGRRVFSGISRFPRPLMPMPLHSHFNRHVGSRDLAVKSRPNLLTHFSSDTELGDYTYSRGFYHRTSWSLTLHEIDFPVCASSEKYSHFVLTRLESAQNDLGHAVACLRLTESHMFELSDRRISISPFVGIAACQTDDCRLVGLNIRFMSQAMVRTAARLLAMQTRKTELLNSKTLCVRPTVTFNDILRGSAQGNLATDISRINRGTQRLQYYTCKSAIVIPPLAAGVVSAFGRATQYSVTLTHDLRDSGVERFWAVLNVEVLRSEVSVEQRRNERAGGKWEIPEEIRRPAASSSTISTMREWNPVLLIGRRVGGEKYIFSRAFKNAQL